MWSRIGALFAVAGMLPAVLGSPSPAAAATDSVHTFLNGAIAFSPSNAWAVGWFGIDSSAANSEALHWNGKTWALVKTAPEDNVNGMEAVSATSPTDMWGVGWFMSNCLIQHYNGKTWASVPCPYHGVISQLNAVDARTKSDAWAVGFVDPTSQQTGFSEHWNGHQWAQVTTAQVNGSFAELNSVLDLGPDNVLAVGDYQTTSHGKSVEHQLAERWNGQAWQRVSTPQITGSVLKSMSGGTSAGVTAVGFITSGGHNVPLIERWTGTRFVTVTQPVTSGDLDGVTVVSRTNAYAVGETGQNKTLVEHYDGKRWTRVSSPNPSDGGFFSSVAASPTGSFVEAAGWHGLDPDERPLIEQGNGRTWRITRD